MILVRTVFESVMDWVMWVSLSMVVTLVVGLGVAILRALAMRSALASHTL